MFDDTVVVLITKVQALFRRHWRGSAGERFRETMRTISDFTEQHRLRPEDLLEDAVVNGRRKLEGLATQEHSAAEKNYAEALKGFADSEDRKIDTEVKRRCADSSVRKAEAEARKLEAEATKAEAEARLMLTRAAAMEVNLTLLKKLQRAGVSVIYERDGDKDVIKVLPLAPGINLLDAEQRLQDQVENEHNLPY